MAPIDTRSVPTELLQDVRYLGGILQEIENQFRGADYTKLLSGFLPELVDEHKTFFENRVDPNGMSWKPLSPTTIKRKGHDIPLVETYRMKNSLLNLSDAEHVGGVTHRGLLFGTEVPYATFQQFGTNRIPARPFVGFTPKLLESVTDDVADQTVEFLKPVI